MANVMISSTVCICCKYFVFTVLYTVCFWISGLFGYRTNIRKKTGFSVRMFGRHVYNIFILNKCILMYRKLHSWCFFPTHCRIHLPVFISCTVLYIYFFFLCEEIASKKLFYNTKIFAMTCDRNVFQIFFLFCNIRNKK